MLVDDVIESDIAAVWYARFAGAPMTARCLIVASEHDARLRRSLLDVAVDSQGSVSLQRLTRWLVENSNGTWPSEEGACYVALRRENAAVWRVENIASA